MGLADLLAGAKERRSTDRRAADRRQQNTAIDFPDRRSGDRRTRADRRTGEG